VQDDFRIVPGSLPAEPVVGTPYTFQVEAIDTTQGNARVTSFNAASVIVGISVALPDGLVVVSGDIDEPMVSGLATFTLTFGVPTPTIISIAPTSGSATNTIVITGTNFIV
jgi:hypothetical protein